MGFFKDEQFEFLDKKTRKILMESRESFIPHTPYSYEKKMLDAIRRGDMRQAKYWCAKVEALALVAGLSAGRFSHLFRKETGISPMAYFHREKLESAKEMLNDSEYKVYEISTILGFSSESHFVKAFREYVGVTPGEYRRRMC